MAYPKELMDTSWLVNEWGIDFMSEGKALCLEYLQHTCGGVITRDSIRKYILDNDIRKIYLVSYLLDLSNNSGLVSSNCDNIHKIKGFLSMVLKSTDISKPGKFADDDEDSGMLVNTNSKIMSMNSKKRLLYLVLTDGKQKFNAFEYRFCRSFSLNNTLPGTKVLLRNHSFNTERSSCSDLLIRNGLVLLSDSEVSVLGGTVEKMIDAFNADNEVREHRVIGSVGGISGSKQREGEGPPKFIPYGKSIDQGDKVKQLKNSSVNINALIDPSTVSRTKTSEEAARFKIADLIGADGIAVGENVQTIENLRRQPKLNMDTFGGAASTQTTNKDDESGKYPKKGFCVSHDCKARGRPPRGGRGRGRGRGRNRCRDGRGDDEDLDEESRYYISKSSMKPSFNLEAFIKDSSSATKTSAPVGDTQTLKDSFPCSSKGNIDGYGYTPSPERHYPVANEAAATDTRNFGMSLPYRQSSYRTPRACADMANPQTGVASYPDFPGLQRGGFEYPGVGRALHSGRRPYDSRGRIVRGSIPNRIFG